MQTLKINLTNKLAFKDCINLDLQEKFGKFFFSLIIHVRIYTSWMESIRWMYQMPTRSSNHLFLIIFEIKNVKTAKSLPNCQTKNAQLKLELISKNPRHFQRRTQTFPKIDFLDFCWIFCSKNDASSVPDFWIFSRFTNRG